MYLFVPKKVVVGFVTRKVLALVVVHVNNVGVVQWPALSSKLVALTCTVWELEACKFKSALCVLKPFLWYAKDITGSWLSWTMYGWREFGKTYLKSINSYKRIRWPLRVVSIFTLWFKGSYCSSGWKLCWETTGSLLLTAPPLLQHHGEAVAQHY